MPPSGSASRRRSPFLVWTVSPTGNGWTTARRQSACAEVIVRRTLQPCLVVPGQVWGPGRAQDGIERQRHADQEHGCHADTRQQHFMAGRPRQGRRVFQALRTLQDSIQRLPGKRH